MNELALDGLLIRTSREFGSSNANHRTQLRHALQDFIRSAAAKSQSGNEEEFLRAVNALTNLAIRPRVPGWALSVSHCGTLGGFIASKNAANNATEVGIDFESASRVSESIAVRVAPFAGEKALLEMLKDTHAPWALFWVAKEAAIKAFGNRFPTEAPHFGEIEITSINLIARTFTARLHRLVSSGRFLDAIDEADASIVGAIASVSQSD